MNAAAAPLPTVRFSESGEVSAAEAVRVERTHPGGGWTVSVLHPQGGRVVLCTTPAKFAAESMARDVQGVLVAWARFSADSPSGSPHPYYLEHANCEYGPGAHRIGPFPSEAAAETAMDEQSNPNHWVIVREPGR